MRKHRSNFIHFGHSVIRDFKRCLNALAYLFFAFASLFSLVEPIIISYFFFLTVICNCKSEHPLLFFFSAWYVLKSFALLCSSFEDVESVYCNRDKVQMKVMKSGPNKAKRVSFFFLVFSRRESGIAKKRKMKKKQNLLL